MSPQSKKRVVRGLVSGMFLVFLIYFFLFTVYGDSIHCFEFLARTTFATYVCIYVHIYVQVLACTSIYVHVVGSFW